MDYLLLAIATLTAIGLGLVYLVFAANVDSSCTNCTGNCNQGRNCDCKDSK
jgi:hypothetical protein